MLSGSFGCWTSDFSALGIDNQLLILLSGLPQAAHFTIQEAHQTAQLGLRGEWSERKREKILNVLWFCTECN